MKYRGATIERDYRGMYLAFVLVGSLRTGHYVPLQADSRSGIRELITETLQANGQTREEV